LRGASIAKYAAAAAAVVPPVEKIEALLAFEALRHTLVWDPFGAAFIQWSLQGNRIGHIPRLGPTLPSPSTFPTTFAVEGLSDVEHQGIRDLEALRGE